MPEYHDGSIECLFSEAYEKIFSEKKNHFLYFVEEHVSFELWLTLELAMYLRERGCDVFVTPRVTFKEENIELNSSAELKRWGYLDLFICNGSEQCAIELKIALPTTQDKYKYDCIYDMHKLANLDTVFLKNSKLDAVLVKKLFILIAISKREEKEFKANWNQWLDEIYQGFGDEHESLIKYKNFSPINNKDLTVVVYQKSVTDNDLSPTSLPG